MSVVRIKESEGRPQSGGGMDRVVERKGLSMQVKIGLAAAGIILLAGLFYWFAPGANSQTVEASRVTISTVARGRFDDFLPLRARVEPLVTVFLDAVEGGRVEQVLVEDGAMVQPGQMLAVLSNSDLQLNVLARQTEVIQQINSMRSQELALSQTRAVWATSDGGLLVQLVTAKLDETTASVMSLPDANNCKPNQLEWGPWLTSNGRRKRLSPGIKSATMIMARFLLSSRGSAGKRNIRLVPS